ncbi:MAG: type I-C CRISPR-associated protein Cas8c/Csd1, partial [Chloroflexia bacterium]|nr:type I-C CRISPR-associated protein Cas8c/Csd1 [Chloroflexia bacterium]
MLLEKLKAYNDRQECGPPMYQRQPVRYVIRLTGDGQPLPPIIDRATKEERRGAAMLAPHVKRANVIRPKLLADNAEYVLGVARKDSRPERVRQLREAFVELVKLCAQETDEAAVRSVAAFLTDSDSDRLKTPEDFDQTAIITFQVDGVFPFELPSVQRFWARHTGAEADATAPAVTTENGTRCIICGKAGPVLKRHPLKIKGVPGGQIVKDLISANNAAFESYGLQNSEIAPTCHACAEGYGNGLNALLAGRDTH